MIVNDDAKSIVSMNKIYFDKIQFTRSEEPVSKENLKIRFTKAYQFREDGASCTVTLGCSIFEKNSDCIKIEASVVGDFSCADEDPARRAILLQKNTLAILFPYLRTQISVITMQPGMEPIVIPPVNIEAVFDEASNA